MAEVKLDISEYELMKEQAKLLKESLKREKELNDKVDALNKERIQALMDNEKNVTIVKKQKVTTTVSNRVSPQDIATHLRHKMFDAVTVILKEITKSPDPFRKGSSHFGNVVSSMDFYNDKTYFIHDLLRNKEGIFNYVVNKLDFRPEELNAMFFHEPVTRTDNLPDEIITKGLDEIKVEMKERAFEELSENARKALTLNPILEKERNDSQDEIKSLNKEIKKAENRVKLSEDLVKTKSEELENALSKFSEIENNTIENIQKLNEINYVISNENGIFANKNKVIKIKQILQKNGKN